MDHSELTTRVARTADEARRGTERREHIYRSKRPHVPGAHISGSFPTSRSEFCNHHARALACERVASSVCVNGVFARAEREGEST